MQLQAIFALYLFYLNVTMEISNLLLVSKIQQRLIFIQLHYRPQTKFVKVMFSHLSVILFTQGVSASVHAGIQPPGADTPSPLSP